MVVLIDGGEIDALRNSMFCGVSMILIQRSSMINGTTWVKKIVFHSHMPDILTQVTFNRLVFMLNVIHPFVYLTTREYEVASASDHAVMDFFEVGNFIAHAFDHTSMLDLSDSVIVQCGHFYMMLTSNVSFMKLIAYMEVYKE